MDTNNNTQRGVGFIGLLTIAFIVLKLTNQINWSWWWVLAPLWIGFAIGMFIVCVILTIIIMFHRD